jgi:hypothetical protein
MLPVQKYQTASVGKLYHFVTKRQFSSHKRTEKFEPQNHKDSLFAKRLRPIFGDSFSIHHISRQTEERWGILRRNEEQHKIGISTSEIGERTTSTQQHSVFEDPKVHMMEFRYVQSKNITRELESRCLCGGGAWYTFNPLN